MTRWLLHVLPLNPINKISKGNKSGLIPTIVTPAVISLSDYSFIGYNYLLFVIFELFHPKSAF